MTLCWMTLADKQPVRILLLTLLLGVTACTSPQKASAPKMIRMAGATMGTTYQVQLYTAKSVEVAAVQASVDQALVAVNQSMSTYIPDSEISTWNQSDMQPIKISSEFAHVLTYALALAKQTGGLYDPTIGPLVALWGFGPDNHKTVPTQAQIKETQGYTGYDKVSLTHKDNQYWLSKTNALVQLDLSSIAKGYGVDVISALLSKEGFKHHYVEIGGEVRTRGSKGGKPWIIGIENPDPSTKRTLNVIKIQNASIATSGNYRNFFEKENIQYGHTIDPNTGKPTHHLLLSASVLEDTCMKADALATALMAMGPEKAWAFAQSQKLTVQLILAPKDQTKKIVIQQTAGWKARVQ